MESLNYTDLDIHEEDTNDFKTKTPEPIAPEPTRLKCTSSTPNPNPKSTNSIKITTTVTTANNNNNPKTDNTAETLTNDEELSDIISLPSITLTNDEYFRWIKNQSLSIAPTSPPFNIKSLLLNNSNAGVSRSDTMTTTHTLSSMHHKSRLSNLNNDQDNDNEEDSDLVKLMEFKKKIESMDSYNFEDSVSEPISKIEHKINLNENAISENNNNNNNIEEKEKKDSVELIKKETIEIGKEMNECKISNSSPQKM